MYKVKRTHNHTGYTEELRSFGSPENAHGYARIMSRILVGWVYTVTRPNGVKHDYLAGIKHLCIDAVVSVVVRAA